MHSASCDPDGYSQWHCAASHHTRLQAATLSHTTWPFYAVLKDFGVDCTVISRSTSAKRWGRRTGLTDHSFSFSRIILLSYYITLFYFTYLALPLNFPPFLLLYSIYVFSSSTPPLHLVQPYWLLPCLLFPTPRKASQLLFTLQDWFLSGSDSRPFKMGWILCPETSINNYYTTPRNIREERRSQGHVSPLAPYNQLSVRPWAAVPSTQRYTIISVRWTYISTRVYSARKTVKVLFVYSVTLSANIISNEKCVILCDDVLLLWFMPLRLLLLVTANSSSDSHWIHMSCIKVLA
jgi:hypothetical protein